jgi:MFS family permease
VTFSRAPSTRQSAAFLWLYALAWAGGAVAYIPFLTILLPMQLAAMVGDLKVEWLAYTTFFGALAASVGGILFGWLSDLTKSRRPWACSGLVLSLALMLATNFARTPLQLLGLIIVWQLALNMMLGPLAAWAADHVPRAQLGLLGGLLAFSPALGSAAGALVTIPGLADPNDRLALVALLVVACVAPGLLAGKPREGRQDDAVSAAVETKHDFLLAGAMWLARFLVQISDAALFAYLYYYFRSIDSSRDAAWIARLFGLVVGLSVPVALLVGRWSDQRERPMLPLVATAASAGLALSAMAASRASLQATAAYVIFGLSSTIFLSLHTAQTFRVLRRSARRGRDLGVFNLTNTVPSLIMPWLTIAIVPEFGFSRLFALLAGLAFAAALILLGVAQRLRKA